MPRAKVTNTSRVQGGLRVYKAEMESGLKDTITKVGREAVYDFRLAAPVRSERLRNGIRARRVEDYGLDITIHAKDPESGYDYAAVTRFGHRKKRIWPTSAKTLKVNFVSGPRYCGSVRGFTPAGDWVDKALPIVQDEAEKAMHFLSSQLEIRVFS